ncbi:hypothetical protein [Paramuribaculum intestinale]|uniref:hypothetical protein n=1 Tax=Paramuribaculum intestinale TaxID=2094151 RepID=UPI0025B5E8F0|nr:hypothetical protein [Paramuribaculum intestinale]
MSGRSGCRAPAWFIVLAVVMTLPALLTPALLSACPPDGPDMVRTLVWIYPFYVVVAAWLACLCWDSRRTMAWVLLALMALTHAGIWMLVNAPGL